MADTLTKSIAARVPMDTYVDIIKKASDLRMTVSDYLIMRLFAEGKQTSDDSTSEKDKTITSLRIQIKDLEDNYRALESRAKEAAKGLGQVPGGVEAGKSDTRLTEKVKAQADQIKAQDKELKNLAKLDEKIKAYQTEVRSVKAKLQHSEQRYNEIAKLKETVKSQLDKANLEIKQLRLQLSDANEQTSIANELISQIGITNKKLYKELEDFNERNTSFLGNEPIGEEFLEKVKMLLFKHI